MFISRTISCGRTTGTTFRQKIPKNMRNWFLSLSAEMMVIAVDDESKFMDWLMIVFDLTILGMRKSFDQFYLINKLVLYFELFLLIHANRPQ